MIILVPPQSGEMEIKMANQKNIVGTVRELLTPVADNMGYSLWDVEFVREGARRILRITIDKPEGINIDDCEAFHRTIDPLLDEADPIDTAYYLEVSSPGVERELKYDVHFAACVGEEIEVRLFAPDERGRKSLRGKLAGLDGGDIVIDTPDGETVKVARTAASKIKTVFDFGD